MIIIAVTIGIIIIVIAGMTITYRRQTKDYMTRDQLWQQGIIKDGRTLYQYKKNMHTYLVMGIDKEGAMERAESYTEGGQADALFLLVTDAEQKKISIIAINRNTMTQVKTYSRDGVYLGDRQAQICVQHGFGDGLEESCQLTENAVQNILSGIPIDGYISVGYDAIYALNHELGGVEVNVLQDINYGVDVDLHKGEKKVLTDNDAYAYVRYRDTTQFNSASDRLDRDIQYIKACYKKYQQSSNKLQLLENIYTSTKQYIYADVSVLQLGYELATYKFDEEHIYNLPGEQVMGDRFVEYYLDEDGVREVIYKVYYDKVIW